MKNKKVFLSILVIFIQLAIINPLPVVPYNPTGKLCNVQNDSLLTFKSKLEENKNGELEFEEEVNCDYELKYNEDLVDSSPTTHLKILEYNIDKNGYGMDSPYEKGHTYIGESLLKFKTQENPDVIVVIEAARNCIQFGVVNIGEYLSDLLQMNFAYSVETLYKNPCTKYVEKNDKKEKEEGKECSIGHLILFNRELVDSGVEYFKNNCCGNDFAYNIKNFLYVDLKVRQKDSNKDYVYRIIGSHLEAGQSDIKRTIGGFVTRYLQAGEITSSKVNEENYKYDDLFIIGDLNGPFMKYDPELYPIYGKNFNDSFENLSYFSRNTCPFSATGKYGFGNLDYIFSKYNNSFEDSVILDDKSSFSYFYGQSDHHPIYTKYRLGNESK